MEFTNDPIDLDLLPRYEEAAIQPLQPTYWNIIVINLLVFLLILAAAAGSLFWLKEATRPYVLPIAGAYLLLTAVLFMLYRLSFKRRGLAVREKDIMHRSGLLSISTTIIPFVRIQHVSLVEGFLPRAYGLATLEIFTAGGATGHLIINGLAVEDARKIKELLLNKLEQDV